MQRNEHTFPKDSFLGRLPDASWDRLSGNWQTSLVAEGAELIKFQDDNRDVFFVLDGNVRATVYTPAGREVSFLSFARGDCIGEFSAIDDAPRSSDAVAETDCTIARVSAERFRQLVRSDSEMAYILMTLLVGHLRRLSQRVLDFNAKSADERLREMLLEIAQKGARGGDEALIESPPTQAQLASIVFSSRESVAREMGRLRRAGVLGRKRRALHFPSVARFATHIEKLAKEG